jgi:hypothetical protein
VPPVAPRRPGSAVPSITELLISPPGVKALLIDISVSGLLAECGVPLKLGQAVTIRFEGTFAQRSVEAQVVRSSVAAMASTGVRYHVGLTFNTPLVLDATPPPQLDATPPPQTGADPRSASAAIADPPSPSPAVNRW